MRFGGGSCRRVEIDQEEDGRFLAEVMELLGMMAHGRSAEKDLAHVQALALRVLVDQLEHDEGPRGVQSLSVSGQPTARERDVRAALFIEQRLERDFS